MLDLTPDRAFEFYRTFLHWYCGWYNPRYLEVGCASGDMTSSLPCRTATGVDVASHVDWDTYRIKYPHALFYKMTSDEFFKLLDTGPEVVTYDLIFIDGDHDKDQVLKDVDNSLRHLADGGLIAMHDTYPPTMDYTHEKWSGTAYLAAQELRKRTDIEVYTFPVTYGLTLVGKIGSGFPWQ